MGRSYLYGGDTRHLTPVQYQLEQLYDRLDTPQRRLTSDEFFKSNEFARFLSEKYGDLQSQVPPGSQILNQTPFKLTYKDPDGYEHTITRAGAEAADAGAISRQTDRPAILPNKGQNDILAQLQARVQQGYTQPPQFAGIPPELQAQLDAMNAAERGDIGRNIEDERGKLIAALFGNNVNRSSIANEAGARFAEGAGRLYQGQASNAAQRTLGLQQFLTNLIQQQGEGAANLYANLSGQGTQRDIAGAGLGLDAEKLQEQIRQFGKQYGLQSQGLQLERERLDAENSGFNKFIKTLHAVGALAGGGGTAYRAYRGY